MLGYLFRTILIPMLLVQFSCDICDAFYVPGVAPQDFAENDKIDVRAIKMTSSHTQLPYEYYSLPFCKPPGEIVYKSQVSLVYTHMVLINRTKILGYRLMLIRFIKYLIPEFGRNFTRRSNN